MSTIGEQSIAGFLHALAAREPAPGGGAAAALHAAQAAALVAMVARYSDRSEGAEALALAERVQSQADALLERAIDLIEADMNAFAAVADAYKLPGGDEAEQAARKAAIAFASVGAAEVPATVIEVAGEVLELSRDLFPVANRNVITDIAAAADAARAAAATARVNVEINLGSISDEWAAARFGEAVAGVDQLLAHADELTATVRRGLSG